MKRLVFIYFLKKEKAFYPFIKEFIKQRGKEKFTIFFKYCKAKDYIINAFVWKKSKRLGYWNILHLKWLDFYSTYKSYVRQAIIFSILLFFIVSAESIICNLIDKV